MKKTFLSAVIRSAGAFIVCLLALLVGRVTGYNMDFPAGAAFGIAIALGAPALFREFESE